MPVTIAVLGDGAWGTAAALILARSSDHHVRLWSARADNGAQLRQDRENVTARDRAIRSNHNTTKGLSFDRALEHHLIDPKDLGFVESVFNLEIKLCDVHVFILLSKPLGLWSLATSAIKSSICV